MLKILVAVCVWGCAAMSAGQESIDPQAEADALARIAGSEAARWRFSLNGDTQLQQHPRSVLRWSNPNVGRVYGEVYVWCDRGCPAVIGSLYKWYAPYNDFTVELKSLGRGRLVGERNADRLWEPEEDDVRFQPVEDAPRPANTSAGRLRQLRQLATDFSVSLHDTRVERVKGTPQELRCLTQPVFRYASQDPDVIDGAIFAFVHGTDPEALLILEARQANEAPHWEFALARLNNDDIRGSFRGTEVWRVPHVQVLNASTAPYSLFSVSPDK
jgi:hypothetical protein